MASIDKKIVQLPKKVELLTNKTDFDDMVKARVKKSL